MKRHFNVCAMVFVVAMVTMTCFASGLPPVCSAVTDIGASGYPTPGWPSTQGIPADYLAGTNKCDTGETVFASSAHCADDGGEEAELFPAETEVNAGVSDGGWLTWSAPPYSEYAYPWAVATYESSNPSVLKIDLAKPASVFGFELEPNAFETNLVSVKFFGSGGPASPLVNVSLNVDGSSGATLFAIVCDSSSILGAYIESAPAAEGFAIAELRSNAMAGIAAPKAPTVIPATVPPGTKKNSN